MPTIFWIQSGACSGDTMSFLNANDPNLNQFFDLYSIQLLWHPSLSPISEKEFEQLIEDIKNEKIPLDIFCVEGSILTGPEETGMFDTFLGRPKMEVVRELCEKANLVLAVGTVLLLVEYPPLPQIPLMLLACNGLKMSRMVCLNWIGVQKVVIRLSIWQVVPCIPILSFKPCFII